MRTALLTLLATTYAFASAKPIVEATNLLEARQPAACPYYCFLDGKVTYKNETVVSLVDDPGCSECPGHNCTGHAHGTWNMNGGMFTGDYWVRVDYFCRFGLVLTSVTVVLRASDLGGCFLSPWRQRLGSGISLDFWLYRNRGYGAVVAWIVDIYFQL